MKNYDLIEIRVTEETKKIAKMPNVTKRKLKAFLKEEVFP